MINCVIKSQFLFYFLETSVFLKIRRKNKIHSVHESPFYLFTESRKVRLWLLQGKWSYFLIFELKMKKSGIINFFLTKMLEVALPVFVQSVLICLADFLLYSQ